MKLMNSEEKWNGRSASATNGMESLLSLHSFLHQLNGANAAMKLIGKKWSEAMRNEGMKWLNVANPRLHSLQLKQFIQYISFIVFLAARGPHVSNYFN